jgi:flagellum-specific peptidoglycan hydrolase FlgJ
LVEIIFNYLILISLTPIQVHNHAYSEFITEHSQYSAEVEREYGVPVGLTLCQSIYESGGGRSHLAEHQNNYFGIKTGDNWEGDSNNGFRCYESARESFLDYGRFISKHYSKAIGHHPDHYFRYCKGYGAPGYWKRLRVIYYDLNLNFYDDDLLTIH